MTENQKETTGKNGSRKFSEIEQSALFYHQFPRAGKLQISPTKPLGNQRDLALAYSPGVAAPCLDIADHPERALDLTLRGNLVAVISNGTAVLGLGAIGALASKPVMEGKAVLFKKFANIDVFDIEIDRTDPDEFCAAVAALEPTFGGINLEDIRAPECFIIEERLNRQMKIPVFHDDQHGTAIIVAAAVLNGLELAGKSIESARIVTSGAGAAALACLNLLCALGARKENIFISDIDGVVYEGREKSMDPWKERFARPTKMRQLAEIIHGADIFLGLSAGGVLKPEMVASMAERPLVLALANPTPEILPDLARAARPDVMICTGRSDFPNQVNNVLCFPYIFRGALDVGADSINEPMKLAAVKAIAELAKAEPSEAVAKAYQGETNCFGADHLIPAPFDPRLILQVAPAVARAAMESGVAHRPIECFQSYREQLERFVFRSGMVMKPIIAQAKSTLKRVIYAEGEDERVLRAAQIVIADNLARPILIGRPAILEMQCEKFGLKIRPGTDFEFVNPENDPRYRDYVDSLCERAERKGITRDNARMIVRNNSTAIAALALWRNDADAMLCGLVGSYMDHLHMVRKIIGLCENATDFSALSLLIGPRRAWFLADTFISTDPSAEEIAEMVRLGAEQIRRFGIEPRAALLSASNFGSLSNANARKMQQTLEILRSSYPDLQIDGEMQGDSALSEDIRARFVRDSPLKGSANFLIFPTLDAANIALNLMKVIGEAIHVGPLLLGAARPAHILAPSATSRGVVNMTAVAAVEAICERPA